MDGHEETKKDSEYRRSDINLDCRFYEDKFPSENDYVKVKVREVVDNGAYVSLLEYNNIEGMITTSEFTTMRLRSFTKVIKEGKQETVLVLRVDREKGYIDLSKKKVNAEDMKKFEDHYQKAKTVHTILRTVADKCNMDLEKIYEMTAWPLYKKFPHAYDAFKISIVEPETVWTGLTVTEEVLKVLETEIKRRLAPNEAKIRADFELTCYTYAGVEGIKTALKAGEKLSTEQIPIKFQTLSAPVYFVVSNTFEKTSAIELITKALVEVEAAIKEQGGSFKLREAPKVVSDKGDQDIKDLMKALEQKQLEDESDEDEDEDNEAMDVDIEGANEEHKVENDEEDDEEDK